MPPRTLVISKFGFLAFAEGDCKLLLKFFGNTTLGGMFERAPSVRGRLIGGLGQGDEAVATAVFGKVAADCLFASNATVHRTDTEEIEGTPPDGSSVRRVEPGTNYPAQDGCIAEGYEFTRRRPYGWLAHGTGRR